MTWERARTIRDTAWDLESLARGLEGEPTPRTVRDFAVPLHKFLNEDALGSAWRAVDRSGEPSIGAKSVACPTKYSKVKQAVPHRIGPAIIASPYTDQGGEMKVHPITTEPSATRSDLQKQQGIEVYSSPFNVSVLPLRMFATSAGLTVAGTPIPRNIAVAFLRHKRGGGHQIDWKLGQSDKKWLYAMLSSVFDPQPIKAGNMHGFGYVKIGHLSVAERYIWTIARDLTGSIDVQAFMSEAVRLLGHGLDRIP